jgi:hypothetical protein
VLDIQGEEQWLTVAGIRADGLLHPFPFRREEQRLVQIYLCFLQLIGWGPCIALAECLVLLGDDAQMEFLILT